MLPIIFIHNRNNDYLSVSLWKVRQTNPDSEIILIGDSQNAHFGMMVTHVHKKQFSKGADQLARHFVNFSTNPHDFELICLQRWMILEEYMKAKGMDSCLYIDSDVLLFDDVSGDSKRFSSFGMTVAGISGHTNFINRLDVLSKFCRFIHMAYQDEKAIARLKERYEIFRLTNPAGGISDMTFFTDFRESYPDLVLDIGVPIEEKMFDITITYTKDVEAENGLKRIYFEARRPFVNGSNGLKIEMRSLHFQGDSKQYMLQMAAIEDFTFKILYAANRILVLIQKILNKFLTQIPQ